MSSEWRRAHGVIRRYNLHMAQRTIVLMTDDLDGESEAAETVSFALDGQQYEIDLSEENAERLRGVFVEWTPYARKTGGRRGARSSSGIPRARAARDDAENPNAIREWAKGAGYEVSPRGRIAQKIRDAYRSAMG